MSALTTAAPIEIYSGQDFYVPTFEVMLRKRPLPKDVVRDVLQVTYKDSTEDIDSFELTINNWDEKTRSFKYSDGDLFNPGEEIELWMGYHGKDRKRLMMTGEITSLRLSFPASGSPTLAVGGLNLLHKLRQKQETATYRDKTDSQIARQIGTRLRINGKPVKVETDKNAEANEHREEYLLQENEYDILFLLKRARFHSYEIFIKEMGADGKAQEPALYFGPSVNLKRVTYRLTYGRTLIEFQPTLSTANQVAEVTVRGSNPVKKQKIAYTAKRSEVGIKGLQGCGRLAAIERQIKERKEVKTDSAPLTEAEARRLAIQTLETIVKDLVKATGSTVGLPDLRTGNVIEVDGLGSCFSGRYFVTSTTHTIGDSGYTTQFECRLEALTGGGQGGRV